MIGGDFQREIHAMDPDLIVTRLTLMPLADVRDLYDLARDPKELWVVDAAAQFGLSVDSDGTEAPARAG